MPVPDASTPDSPGSPDNPASHGRRSRQPWLHELSVVVDGNATVLSDRSGDVVPGTAQGLYVDDRRLLHTLTLEVAGEAPTPVAARASGAVAHFAGAARGLGNPGPDPTVEVVRTRTLSAARGRCLTEHVTVTSRADATVTAALRFVVAGDGRDIAAVKAGHVSGPATPVEVGDDRAVLVDDWHRSTVSLDASGWGPVRVRRLGEGAVLEAEVRVEPGGSASVVLGVLTERVTRSAFDADAGAGAVAWSEVAVTASDHRLGASVRAGLDDLQHLLLRDPEQPSDVFAAAGSPWYLTLFGRDSLWSARLLLPFGTELAGGTLRALARRQGRVTDPLTGEAPGRMPHEVRRHVLDDPDTAMTLPQVYYGTVDATPLWICLLAEAHDWGLPREEVVALLPALRCAVGWITGAGRPDADLLLKYVDETGTGLSNQGWKDSGDAIRGRDGVVATAPIALVEAQAYAVEALRAAARLYRAVGAGATAAEAEVEAEAEAAAAEAAADRLADALRRRFWVDTDAGHHLALALDGDGRPVDGLASNLGHVLGTGALTPEEASLTAAQLTGPELLDPFGVRTFGTGNVGFNPVGYHTGSIWTHDTAIAALNLAREGLVDDAVVVARTLLASAEAFGYRWPELYSGLPFAGAPTPYPASCRPQAWSAASAAALVSVALGPRPDASTRTLHLHPARPAPFGALRVEGLRFLCGRVDVEVDASGALTVLRAPAGVEVEVH